MLRFPTDSSDPLTIMTFNPSRYDHSYGFHLLDDIHNLFPEFLYDAGLFPANPLITFLQMRTNELFPEEYMRHRSHYRLYQLQRRREAVLPPATQAIHTTPARRSTLPTVPPAPRRPVRPTPLTTPAVYTIPLTGNATDAFTNLFTTLLGQELTDLLTPVPVVPTAQELAAASIVCGVEPPLDVVCAICQDHEQPTESGDWRILRHCQHRFHRSCIDTWFQQNVHCPVCRHDIRDS